MTIDDDGHGWGVGCRSGHAGTLSRAASPGAVLKTGQMNSGPPPPLTLRYQIFSLNSAPLTTEMRLAIHFTTKPKSVWGQ